MLNWRSLNCPHEKHMVKGSELSVAFVAGLGHRFAIYEIRTRELDGSGTRYVVRDADSITDAQIKDGARPPIVFNSDDPAECEKFCIDRTVNNA